MTGENDVEKGHELGWHVCGADVSDPNRHAIGGPVAV